MTHKHRWIKVYRFDGKTFRPAGLWLRVGRGQYTEHNAVVCERCGRMKLVGMYQKGES